MIIDLDISIREKFKNNQHIIITCELIEQIRMRSKYLNINYIRIYAIV